MRVTRILQKTRTWLALGLLGLPVLTAGCGSNPDSQPAAPATTPAQQDAERAAREKAYGKVGVETKASTPKSGKAAGQ